MTDSTDDRLCPCGGDLEPGMAYCGDDCIPTHLTPDTGAVKDPWADVMPA